MYVWIIRMPLKRACGYRLFLIKTRPFRLHPSFFWYYSIKKVLLETWAPNCEIISAKCSFVKTQNIDSTGYYGIEDPFPDLVSKLRRFGGIPCGDCWLSRAIGSQNAVILMLRKLRSRFTLGPTLSAPCRVTLRSHRDARALSPSERDNMRRYAPITLTTVVVVQ